MRAPVLVLSSCVLLAVGLGVSRPAEACSPAAPGVTGSFPEKGAVTYPANAPIVLRGHGFDDGANLVATVAGKPATVATLTQGSQNRLGRALSLSPQPTPGDAVTLKGNACGAGSGAGCEVDLSYQAGPADTEAPAAPATVSYDVHDYVDFRSSGGDCQSDSDLALWVSFPAPAVAAGSEFWIVEARKKDAAEPIRTAFLPRTTTPISTAFRLLASDAADVAKGGVCVTVRGYDLAGNESSSASSCAPCRARVDPQGETGGKGAFSPAEQPAWTPSDVVPGGSCAGPGAGGGGGAGAAGSDAGGQTSGAGAGGGAGSGGASSGLAPVQPAGDDGGCSLGARPVDQSPARGAGLVALGSLGLLFAQRRRRAPLDRGR